MYFGYEMDPTNRETDLQYVYGKRKKLNGHKSPAIINRLDRFIQFPKRYK